MTDQPTSSVEWSNEKCLLLIDLYKESTNLWNTKHKDYRNRYIRQDSFLEITSKEEVDRKLKNLICHFWREVKKVKQQRSGDGADDVYCSKWFAFKSFEFLKDRNDYRPTIETGTIQAMKFYNL
ncbi:uncharacterized protein LOC132948646 [Metopolophium dirhodum]|uniref:uncharacterized protein LOC132948646 n=1 Tax=Metopolophium dirhodum TaxID=44670 RepID=UPI00299008CE|nr:uncharacterized protein LOC132948646 [Metopolophium dirhodum]